MSCFKNAVLKIAVLITTLFLIGTFGALQDGFGIKCFCLLICDMAIFEMLTIYRAAILAEYPDTKFRPHISFGIETLKFLYLLGVFVNFDERFIVIHLASYIILEIFAPRKNQHN